MHDDQSAEQFRHENLDRWLLTYADMITLLTAFFLMLYSMSIVNKDKFDRLAISVRSGFGAVIPGGRSALQRRYVADSPVVLAPGITATEYQNAVRNLTQYVEQQFGKSSMTAKADERGLVISLLADNALFDRGKADLRPEARGVLDRVAAVLKSISHRIRIEGHTCDLPIRTAQFPSNWELSTARAGTILRYLTDQSGLDRRRFEAAGYADTRPGKPNTSEAARASNRRVDIVLVKTDSQQEADIRRRAEIRRVTGDSRRGP